MNLHQRIREVRSHIDWLQETANKHKANGKKRRFDLTCQVIKDNKLTLRVLREDLRKHNKIISSKFQHE